MKKVILVFVKLKEGVDRAAFEAFEHRVSTYNVTLPSHQHFRVLRAASVLNDEQTPLPYDYIEIVDVESLALMYQTVGHDTTIQAFMAEFKDFAENSTFLVTDTIVDVHSA